MFVLTVDQRGSRTAGDAIPDLLSTFAGAPLVRGFERTAGDEAQAVADDPALVVRAVLSLARQVGAANGSEGRRGGAWSVGVGAGEVRRPLPSSTRAGAGEAFELARTAVERAKSSSDRLAVRGADPQSAADAQAVLALLADVVRRRTAPGWQVVDLLAQGMNQSEAAQRLGITRQAVSQRASAAGWRHERDVAPLAADLLRAAQGSAVLAGEPAGCARRSA